MIETLLFIAGAVGGAIAAWFAATLRARAAAAGRQTDLHHKLSAAETTVVELRTRVTETNETVGSLRSDLQSEQQARVAAETRLTESLKNIEQQRKLLDEAQVKLKDAFAALSTEALRGNSEEFARKVAERVEPLNKALERYESQIRKIEQARNEAYGGITEQIKNLYLTSQNLSKQTTTLSTALRSPQVKGRWGEITLRRTVEVAGLSPHCDFLEQPTIADGTLRPDLIVTLPANRTIIVDAKAPTTNYLNAIEAKTEEGRAAEFANHARAIRAHMNNLATKNYWSQFEATPEFVVMFIPGEAFFSAALEQDRNLIEEGIAKKVILASPTTLIALLRSVAAGWQQQQLVDHAREISETARELFERICKFAEHFDRIGDSLGRATEAFNDAVGSWQRRVLPSGRNIAKLGIRAKNEAALGLHEVEAAPRTLPEAVVRTLETDAERESDQRAAPREDVGA